MEQGPITTNKRWSCHQDVAHHLATGPRSAGFGWSGPLEPVRVIRVFSGRHAKVNICKSAIAVLIRLTGATLEAPAKGAGMKFGKTGDEPNVFRQIAGRKRFAGAPHRTLSLLSCAAGSGVAVEVAVTIRW